MRRFLTVAFVLLFAIPCLAQEWPGLAGDQIMYQEPEGIQMYLEEWNDRNPWSMPSPVGKFFYFGSLLFDVCEDENIAVLDFSLFASRICTASYWSPLVLNVCSYWNSRDFEMTYTLVWNEDAEAYIVEGNGHWGVNVLALTVGEPVILQMGVMQLVDDEMVWDDTYTWYKYVIEPWTAEERMPIPRRLRTRRPR